jgi:acetyltransferase-like isoleucine patch superfamily enzyme
MLGFIVHRLRSTFWTLFYRTIGRPIFRRLGKGARFEGWVDIPQKGGRISIGDQAYICRFVEFSVPAGGELLVGDKVFIGRGVVISAHRRVSIGKHTMLGEYVSIHDNDHRSGRSETPIAERGYVSDVLEIGSNCWVGAKAVLVRGSSMGENCMLGAGAVLTRNLLAGTTAVGVPAKPISRSVSGEIKPQ